MDSSLLTIPRTLFHPTIASLHTLTSFLVFFEFSGAQHSLRLSNTVVFLCYFFSLAICHLSVSQQIMENGSPHRSRSQDRPFVARCSCGALHEIDPTIFDMETVADLRVELSDARAKELATAAAAAEERRQHQREVEALTLKLISASQNSTANSEKLEAANARLQRLVHHKTGIAEAKQDPTRERAVSAEVVQPIRDEVAELRRSLAAAETEKTNLRIRVSQLTDEKRIFETQLTSLAQQVGGLQRAARFSQGVAFHVEISAAPILTKLEFI